MIPVPPPRDSLNAVTLRDLLTTLFKYKTLIIVTVVTAVVSTTVWIWIVPSTYEASAKVLIKFGRDVTSPRWSVPSSDTPALAITKPDINSEAQLIKSYTLVDQIVTDLNLHNLPEPPPPPDLLKRIKFEMRRVYTFVRDTLDEIQIRLAFKERLTKKEKITIEIIQGLDVVPVKDSSVIEVKLKTRFKEGSGFLVNTLLELYRERQLGMQMNPGVAEFFRRQGREYQQKLIDTEQALSELKTKDQLAALDEQTSLTLKQAIDVEFAVRQSETILEETRAKVALLQQQLQREPETELLQKVDERNGQLDWLDEKRAALMLDRERLAGKYQPDQVQITDLDRQIASLATLREGADGRVQRSQTIGESQTRAGLRRQLLEASQLVSSTEAKLASQRATAAGYRNRLQTLAAAESPYNRLVRDIGLYEEGYRRSERYAEEVAAAEALNNRGITSITVLDPAVDPIVPGGMRKIYLIAGALAVGLVLAVGIAFGAEALDSAVKRSEQLERALQRPVLATIPRVKRVLTKRGGSTLIEHALPMLANIPALDGPAPTVVLFLGARTKAGTSTIVDSAAEALTGRFNRRVLIVNVGNGVSIREPSAQPPLSLAATTESFETRVDALNPRLSRAPAVSLSYDLPSAQVAHLVRGLPARVPNIDHVLVDIAASLSLPQQMAVARGCDAVVMVVEAERTRAEVLERLASEYARAEVTLTGSVLNKQRRYVPAFIYRRL